MLNTVNEQVYLDKAIARVTKMLADKDTIWTATRPRFDNFDIHEGFGLTSIQFALVMCNLKLNRLKNCWGANSIRSDTLYGFEDSPDAEDTLIDLASYALLGLGLLYRQRDRNNADKQQAVSDDDGFGIAKGLTEAHISTPEGRAEIEAYAREIMAGGPLPTWATPPSPSALDKPWIW